MIDYSKMKDLVVVVSFLLVGILISCGETNIIQPIDPNVQRAEDIEIINTYLEGLGYDPNEVDTTESGVRYIILDEGQVGNDELMIDESDIVTFNYIGKLTTEILFDTSIESLAKEEPNIYNELRTYEPVSITYTSTGWSFRDLFIDGFEDGISATFNGLHIDGHALIIIPSNLGYGSQAQFNSSIEIIPANAVLIFELFPISLLKQ